MTPAVEFNFDGLIGPTHNYAGLAHGNLASQQNRQLVSHPKQAALQGLEKMKFLADLGVPQAVLPPQPRPHLAALRRLGFAGSDADVLARAARDAPQLLAACSSASAMWAANAATISPSADAADGRLHLTPANLVSHLHRALETDFTATVFRAIFPGPLFAHHPALPSARETADEGAANHSRLCGSVSDPGIELFTHGAAGGRFQARQTLAACHSLARLHALDPARTFYLQKSPEAIDAGAFHNDVVAVAHRHLFLFHERAYVDSQGTLQKIAAAFERLTGKALLTICVPNAIFALGDAVASYLFNSQIVTSPTGALCLIAPLECQAESAQRAIAHIQERCPLQVLYIDVRQSMMNGGGPACLRLRITLTEEQRQAMHPGIVLTDALYRRLREWIAKYYREELHPAELADPHLLAESSAALNALGSLLQLPLGDSVPHGP